MAKVLFEGKVEAIGAEYKGQISDGKLELVVGADLSALVDKAAAAIPGDSPIEILVVNLVKQGIKAL